VIAPFTQQVTLVTRTVSGQDAYGNDVFTETSTVVDGCVVWPRDGNGTSGNEQVQGKDMVIVGLSLLLPAGTVVTATDRIVVNGLSYEVTGEPGHFSSPFTGLDPGVLVGLTRVTG